MVDLLLVAVKPEYQSKGVNAIIFNDLIPRFNANGYKFAESNVELEGNESVQKQWEYYEHRQHRRRRDLEERTLMLVSIFQTIEFYVVMIFIAAAVIGLAAMPSRRVGGYRCT